MSTAAPYVYVIVGASGSGKSSRLRLAIEQARRAVIFDPMREFAYAGTLADLAGAKRLLIGAAAGPCSITLQPGADRRGQFNKLCELVYKAEDVDFIVDEAHEVLSPMRHEILPWWHTLIREGRHRRLRITLASHRPADLDKALWGFATRLRCGRLNYGSDQRELADVLNVDRDELKALVNRQWIERDMLTGAIERGMIEWRAGRPVDIKKSAGRAPSQ